MRLITALLASAFALGPANGEAQLLPAGEFAARDGRPGPGAKWIVTDAQGRALAAEVTRIAALTPIVIDYEHQTLASAENGKPAPAAGWIHGAEWRPGVGLFARVEWTAGAKALIESGQYRYISPVIQSDDATGAITGVLLAALVNHPALLGMEAVVAQLATQFTTTNAPIQERRRMDLLAALITALGMSAETKDEDMVAAVTELKNRMDKPPMPAALSAALGLQTGADEAAALSAVASLKTADQTTTATIQALQGQVTALRAQATEREVTELVDGAIAAAKLLPAQRDWALGMGRKDVEQLKAYLAVTPAIEGLSGQVKGSRDPGASQAPKAGELARKAQEHMQAQAALGVQLSSAEAVRAVMAKAA